MNIIENLCKHYFKKGRLEKCVALTGGARNHVYKIVWEGKPYVVRIYQHGGASVESSVYDLVHKSVPMPKLFHIEETFGIFEFIDKKHISEVSGHKERLCYDLGKALASIHRFRFPNAGLFDGDFSIHTPFAVGSSPYLEYVEEHFVEGSRAWRRLGESRSQKLRQFIHDKRNLFPMIREGSSLVHSDFKPVNLLWSENEGLTVLDWEFAHIGSPLIDFAILLRHDQVFPFDPLALEKGYTENGGILENEWMQKARITDIINLVQLLNAEKENAKLFRDLTDSLDFTMRYI